MSGAKVTGQLCGNLHGDGAIHQQAVFVTHRQEHAGVRTTRANRQKDVALVTEGQGPARAQVARDHAQRDAHLLETVELEKPLQEPLHALASQKAHAAQGPAAHVAETHTASDPGDLGGLHTARVRCRHDGAGAHARDAVDRNSILFEDLEHARVGNPAGESAP